MLGAIEARHYVIDLLFAARSETDARHRVMDALALSDSSAEIVLSMPFWRMNAESRADIERELDELMRARGPRATHGSETLAT